MTSLTVKVTINKPIEEVFTFTIDPANTPKWVDSVAVEQTNEWPVKVGTVYRSQNRQGVWSEFILTSFQPNTSFTLSKSDRSRVCYEFTSLDDHTTRLDYTWASDVELGKPFLEDLLAKLKMVTEAR